MNNIITVIEIIKQGRFKSNNVQCWQLPGPVSLETIFSLELFISLSCTPQIQLHGLKNPRAARIPVICRHLYRALHFSSCKDQNAEALGGTATGDWCINLPLLNINSWFLLSVLPLCQTAGVVQGADLKYFALIPIFTQWDVFEV